jgi:hypothetical protein
LSGRPDQPVAPAIGDAFKLTISGETYKIRREARGYCTCVPHSCAFIWFNETGIAILRDLAEDRGRDEIVARMCATTRLSPDYWRKSVDDFLEYLTMNEILREPLVVEQDGGRGR